MTKLATTPPHNADTSNMVRVVKDYGNGNKTVLFVAAYCNEGVIRNIPGSKFLDTPHGQRETMSFHKGGVVVSSTDVHCSNAPVRRRSVFLCVWIEADETWDMWCVESYTGDIRYGKRLIDRILETGEIPARC
jgi:hypothetical protein